MWKGETNVDESLIPIIIRGLREARTHLRLSLVNCPQSDVRFQLMKEEIKEYDDTLNYFEQLQEKLDRYNAGKYMEIN